MAPDDGATMNEKTSKSKKSRRVLFNTSVSVFTPGIDQIDSLSADEEDSDCERSLSPVISGKFNKTLVQSRLGDVCIGEDDSSTLERQLGVESDDQSNSPSPVIAAKYLRDGDRAIVTPLLSRTPEEIGVKSHVTHEIGREVKPVRNNLCLEEYDQEHLLNAAERKLKEETDSLNWSNDSIGEKMLDIEVDCGSNKGRTQSIEKLNFDETDRKLASGGNMNEQLNFVPRESLRILTNKINIDSNCDYGHCDVTLKEKTGERNLFGGFQIVGSRKTIKVSAAALELARKKLFDDDDTVLLKPTDSNLLSIKSGDSCSGVAMVSGFKTAGGKNVSIVSESSIMRSNEIIQSVEQNREEIQSKEKTPKIVTYATANGTCSSPWTDQSPMQAGGEMVSGFKTAKGSSVVIKADSIARSERIMQEADKVLLDRCRVDEDSTLGIESIASFRSAASSVTPWTASKSKLGEVSCASSSRRAIQHQATTIADKTHHADMKSASFKTPAEMKNQRECLTAESLNRTSNLNETPIRTFATGSCCKINSHINGPATCSDLLRKPSPNVAMSRLESNNRSSGTPLSKSIQFKPVAPRMTKECKCAYSQIASDKFQLINNLATVSNTESKLHSNGRHQRLSHPSPRSVQFKSPMVAMSNHGTPLSKKCATNSSTIGTSETSCTRTPLTINKVTSDHELCSERVDKRRAVQLKAAREGKLGLVYNVKLALNQTSKFKNLMDLKASSSVKNVEARTSLDLGCYSFDKDLFVSSPHEFKFRISQFFAADDIDEGRALIGDRAEMKLNGQCGLIGVRDFHQALLTCNSVSQSVATFEWVQNAYRWIIWKLASYAVCFPGIFDQTSFCLLSPDLVMFQLRYRYDKEYQMGQRSALRRIVEHDDTPMKLMVLFVSKVNPASPPYMEVSDGWYCIPCDTDQAMRELIYSGKVKLGRKIAVCGSQLINAPQPTGPLEMSDSVRLKISYNGCRPANWDAKLGFVKDILTTSVGSTRVDGGSIPWMRVLVQRVYPKQFTEYLQNGNVVNMTQRQYTREIEKRRDEWESKRQTRHGAIDDAFDDVDDDVGSRPDANVKAILKIRITDVERPDTSALLNVYRIDENLVDELKEGRDLQICNLKPIKHYPREHPHGLILSTTNLTQFIPPSKKSRDSVFPRFLTRQPIISFSQLDIKSRFDEFDIVGMVVRVNDRDKASAVFICDENSKIALVQFPQALIFLALEKIITVKSLVRFKNLKLMRWSKSVHANRIIRFEFSLDVSDVQSCVFDEVAHFGLVNPATVVSEAQKAAHQYIKSSDTSAVQSRGNLTRSFHNDTYSLSRKRPYTSLDNKHETSDEMTYEKRFALLRRHPSPQKQTNSNLLTVPVNKGAKAEYKRPF
ncbi:uncharacterized protein LOC142339388 isoform X3 [Convolutriloba macropyga]|uniref:uncharacterized protein LOC142339388 isoform X3 n=1 Tax=Convolutriloba macropyga TaxID=536237 RepID=UPI003F528243